MGADKALLPLGGKTLVERCILKLSAICAEVAIAGGAGELQRFGRLIPDAYPGCGPLGGIVSALEQSSFEWNLFLPVDAPFVPVECLKALLTAARHPDVGVMARVEGRLQPLCGVFSRSAAGALRQEINAGRWKVETAIRAAGAVTVIDFANMKWFANLNTPKEFAEAEAHVDSLDTETR